jgi:hypothetical protein
MLRRDWAARELESNEGPRSPQGESWELRAYVGGRSDIRGTFRGAKREADEALARFVTDVSGGGHAAKYTTLSELICRRA